ncbi:uncharacterized protein LOC122274351 [Carya illinoinensis]|uniref:uncharacterized protein LOC122274351 n=1 Tax=Carya illinoinensis TaxID=32201 RepID=UPI001C71B9F6|nr:uncharacterized protein LOC122274351 [Carya illinoinensis]
MEKIRNKLGFDQSFVVDSIGKSGGLALLWKNEVKAQLTSYSRSHIAVTITPEYGGQPWLLSGFYGNPSAEKRKGSWQLLRMLKPENHTPWLCMGDFNEILSMAKKSRAAYSPFSQMERFREALDACELSDLGYIGSKFTWSNKRDGGSFTKERLDRALGNATCPLLYSNWEVHVLPVINSDHSPLFLVCDNGAGMLRKEHKLFRYEASWSKREGCKDTVERAWMTDSYRGHSLSSIKTGMARCRHQLRSWQKTSAGIEEALQGMEPMVTLEMNRNLLAECTFEEVKNAVFEMQPLSSPGPDGFCAGFYQDNWTIVGDKVFSTVKDFFSTRSGTGEVNDTYIVSIPKKKCPDLVTEYRPISLCNVLYKIVAKVLANRLKAFLPSIIAPAQSAFVIGRLISDNIIVAYEAIHSMQYRMRSKKEGYMALKLDMSKAYDRIEWAFLQAVLRKMGFAEAWTKLIMERVTSVRGLRQGEPLSPYLFILCFEVLGGMLDKAKEKGLVSRFPFARGSLLVNHLFFADDSLLFCRANALEWNRLIKVLNSYENASGQRLNMDKTSIYFSKNTSPINKETILAAAQVKEAKAFEKYLGLPSYVGRHQLAAFRPILDSIRNKI